MEEFYEVKGEEGGYRLVINYDRLARYGEEFSIHSIVTGKQIGRAHV